jgi:hypothetical protein
VFSFENDVWPPRRYRVMTWLTPATLRRATCRRGRAWFATTSGCPQLRRWPRLGVRYPLVGRIRGSGFLPARRRRCRSERTSFLSTQIVSPPRVHPGVVSAGPLSEHRGLARGCQSRPAAGGPPRACQSSGPELGHHFGRCRTTWGRSAAGRLAIRSPFLRALAIPSLTRPAIRPRSNSVATAR